MLEIRNLNVHYGAIHALQGINVTVEQGKIVTLLGANGAGKSTTLRAISGLLRQVKGDILYQGRSLFGRPPHDIVRDGIAQVPEGRGIFPDLSVLENLNLGAYIRSDKKGIEEDRERALTLFPRIRERLQQKAGTLSGGEQQMLATARALLARPKLLLLDEPSLGLAPQIVLTIFRIIREINETGTTILLVEQNAHMALQAAHYAYVLECGRITMHDDAKALAESDAVKKAYLGG
ncbi:ABC transporter ATP-binding protein [Candidatus Sumerlaeota bacterium]|nr:ABC transporter ATP-binding protein [Candidatus Sumerlaeota bacterium]